MYLVEDLFEQEAKYDIKNRRNNFLKKSYYAATLF